MENFSLMSFIRRRTQTSVRLGDVHVGLIIMEYRHGYQLVSTSLIGFCGHLLMNAMRMKDSINRPNFDGVPDIPLGIDIIHYTACNKY